MDDAPICPSCAGECYRDSVDIGIGEIHGPWGCPECGWSSSPEYDCREGLIDDGDRVIDQFGVSHSKQRIEELGKLLDKILPDSDLDLPDIEAPLHEPELN